MVLNVINDFKKKRLLIIISLVIIALLLITNLIVERIKRRLYGVAEGVTYEGESVEYLFWNEVRNLVREDAEKRRVWSRSADIDAKTGRIIAEKEGKIIDIESTVKRIMEAEAGTAVTAKVYQIDSYPTEEDLKKVTEVIGSYKTSISGSRSRLENIKLAAESINNQLLYSDEVFSFNQVVGPRTEEQGYKEGPVLYNGTAGSGIGGGVCQVSSTLYNAVQEANLQIIERYPHSSPVRYVPEGQDAAVAWNLLDFKFHNQYLFPLIIKGSVHGRTLVIKILGYQQE
ncbi:VanW family protein [Acetohalobium arabaticum]|uniref:VanW family protein n=1 Tax=Acetohalobium arabaticum (strain ATCC 49924 / DSM 5501 / Z-7288) TaxID=574087 RepID=D9QRE9_ACEAZ|nr:VanW family protein [Acetohalobium arabaticum]ADL13090.1 VanW family protein [Acetohalobium arabaticum DSM 5501]